MTDRPYTSVASCALKAAQSSYVTENYRPPGALIPHRVSSLDANMLDRLRLLVALKELIDYVQEISPPHPVIARSIATVQSCAGGAS